MLRGMNLLWKHPWSERVETPMERMNQICVVSVGDLEVTPRRSENVHLCHRAV